MADETSGKLKDLVKALDSLDLSKLTIGELRSVSNPVLADALRTLVETQFSPTIPRINAGHTSHLNHMSHFNHMSHSSSFQRFQEKVQE